MAATDVTTVSAHEAAEDLRARVSSGDVAVSAVELSAVEAAERLEELQAAAARRHAEDESGARLDEDRAVAQAEWVALNDPAVRSELDELRALAVAAAVDYIAQVREHTDRYRAFVDRAGGLGFDVDARFPSHLREVLPRLGADIVAAAGGLLPWQDTRPLLDTTGGVWGS